MHHILIVEDEKIVATDIKYMLKKIDMTSADIAQTATDAFAKIQEKKPDIILMDINLSGEIDGVQAAEIILKDYKIPVMYLTAYADEKTVERAKHTEPIGYLLKPFNEIELKTNIEIALYKQKINEKLRRQELWLSSTLTRIGLGIIKTDAGMSISLMNNVAETMIGMTLEKAEGKKLSEVVSFFDLKKEKALPLTELKSSQRTVSIKNNDGQYLPISLTVQKEENDEEISTVYFLQDISEKLGAEKKIRSTEQLLEQTFQSLQDTLFITKDDFSIINCNPAGIRLFGYSENELVGRSIFLLCNDDREKIEQLQQICRQELFYSRHEFELYNRNGELISTEITLAPLRDENEATTGWVFTLIDIRERKIYERRLKEAKETAESASRAKSEFLTNMSHELRTPLNSIIGMTELTLETSLSRDQKEYLEIVHQSSLSFLVLLNSILDFSKIETGKIELEDTLFDVKKVCQDAIDVMKVQAFKKGLGLRLQAASDVPATVIGDPHRLNQIILNLIGNAVKFTETGYVRLTVHIDSVIDHKVTLLFSVEDTGIGIPEDKQETIFESFKQVDGSTTRKYGGTGLGLTISKKLVELMHGILWVESRVHHGSKFSFTALFGLTEEEVPELKGKIHNHDQIDVSGNMKILVAEDDLFTQKMIQRALEKRGNTVFCVDNGKSAISLLHKIKFDILLLDINMPVMDGYETAKIIRESDNSHSLSTLPIIAITAHAQQTDREKCLAAGMNGYLPKPIHITDLVRTIESFRRKDSTLAHIPVMDDKTRNEIQEEKYDLIAHDDENIHVRIEKYIEEVHAAIKREEHHVLERLAEYLLNDVREAGMHRIIDETFKLKLAARDATMKRAKSLFLIIKKGIENYFIQEKK
ncbi:MAG: response regulator [Spirochaetales bacterium]|nr:response regulator [Spirochaetales bacterium]